MILSGIFIKCILKLSNCNRIFKKLIMKLRNCNKISSYIQLIQKKGSIKFTTFTTSIEIKQIYGILSTNRNVLLLKVSYEKMQNENSFTDKRFLSTLKINP